MIGRATAEAALEAFQRTALAGREYGEPINAAMALTGELSQNELLLLGLSWLCGAGAEGEQLTAARELSGYAAGQEGALHRVGVVMRLQMDVLPYVEAAPVTLMRLALACLDQGDMFARVTPARLVEVLTWLQRDLEAAS